MVKKLVRCFFCLCVFFLFIHTLPSAFAQPAPDQAAEKKQALEKTKKMLGKWWQRNPLSYDSVPEQFLYHFEAAYAWSRMTGNFNLDKHTINSLATLRKKIFTYNLRYALDKRDVSKPKAPPYHDELVELRKSTRHDLHNDFRMALTDRLIAGAGMFWLKDDFIKIENKYTSYCGLGYTAFKHPRLKINLFGAYGYEVLEHTDEYHENYLKLQDWGETEGIDYDPGTETYSVIYLHQAAQCYVTRSIALNESINYYVEVGDMDRYRWDLNISADIKIIEHVFASIMYDAEFDNAPASVLGIRKRDTSLGVGLKISF